MRTPVKARRHRTFAELTGVHYPEVLLPFVLPDLTRDLPKGIYITLELARRQPDPMVVDMYATAQRFFARLAEHLLAYRAGSALHYRRALRMASFPEAPELGLGYTRSGRRGKGARGHSRVSTRLVDSLAAHPGFAHACAEEPDAIALVPQMGLDRISDAIATICKGELIYFTQQQAQVFGFDSRCMSTVTIRNVWSEYQDKLVDVTTRLPVADDGHAILLIPSAIARSSPPVRAEQYARIHRLDGLSAGGLKRRILEENSESPGRLLSAMREVFKHEHWIRPRREYRGK